MLMSSAIRDMSHCLPDHNLDSMAYVYLQWDLRNQQTATAVLASILQKLRPNSKTLILALQELYKDLKKSNTLPEAQDLRKVLVDHGRRSDLGRGENQVGQTTHARFLVLLDGLDEASEDTRKEVISCVNGLDERCFKVVITSRTDLSITTDRGRTKPLQITTDPDDLAVYIQNQIEDTQDDLGSTILQNSPGLLSDLILDIRDRANGMWVCRRCH